MSDSNIEYLQCLTCSNFFKNGENNTLVCNNCDVSVLYKDGKAFFLETMAKPRTSEVAINVRSHWTVLRKSNYEFYKDEIKKISKKDTLLDVGVGPAQFHDLFADINKVVGIDFEPYSKADVISDLSKPMPIQSNYFDVVISSNVLEHIPYPAVTLHECARVLKPGGIFVASVPFLLMVHQKPYDFYRYTEFALQRLCEDAGFTSVRIEPLGASIDVVSTNFFHFLKELFNYTATIKNPVSKFSMKIVIRVVSAVSKIGIASLQIVGRKLPQNKDYTMGYGIVAVKK